MFIKIINLTTKVLDGSFEKNAETLEFIESVNKYIEVIKNRNNIDLEKNKFHKNYGINNFEKILYLVYQHNMSILEACLQYDLNKENISVIKLIFARKYYTSGDYITGDLIIKHVEQSNNKSKFILDLINELRRDKKFYKNRISDDTIDKEIIFTKKINL